MRKGQLITYRNQPGRVVEARNVTPGMVDIQLDSEDFVRRARANDVGSQARANGSRGRKRRRRGGLRARQNTDHTFTDSTGTEYHSDKLFRSYPVKGGVSVKEGASVIWSGDLKAMIGELSPDNRPDAGGKGFPIQDVIKLGALRGRIGGPLGHTGTVGVWFEVPRAVGDTTFTSSWYTHMPLAWLNVEAPLGPVKVKGQKVEPGEEQAWLLEAQEAGLIRKKGVTEKELKFAKPRPERQYQGPAADSLVSRQGAALTTRPDPPRMSADGEGICGNPIDGTAYYLLVSTRTRYVKQTVTKEQYTDWKEQQAGLAIATPADPWLYGGLELSLNDRTEAMLAKKWGVKTIRIEGVDFVAKGHSVHIARAWADLLDEYLTVTNFLQSLAGDLLTHPVPLGIRRGDRGAPRVGLEELRERAVQLGVRPLRRPDGTKVGPREMSLAELERRGITPGPRLEKGKVRGKVKKQARIEEVSLEEERKRRGREKKLPMPVSEPGSTLLIADAEGRATFELKKGEQPAGKLYWYQVGSKPSFFGDRLTALNPYDRRNFTSHGGELATEMADYLKSDLGTANAIIRSGGVRVAPYGASGLGRVAFSNREIPSGSKVTIYYKDKARSPFFSFVFQGEGIPPQDMLAACEPESFDASGRTIKGRLQVLQQGAVRVLNRVNSSLGTTRNFIGAALEPIRNADRLMRASNSTEKFRRLTGSFTSLARWVTTVAKEEGALETLKVDIGPYALRALEMLERRGKNVPSMADKDKPFDDTLLSLIMSGGQGQRDPAALFAMMSNSFKSTGDLDPRLRALLQQEQFAMDVSWGPERGKRFDKEGRLTDLGAAPGRARIRPAESDQAPPWSPAADRNWTAALIMDAFNTLSLEGALRLADRQAEGVELREIGLMLANKEISKEEANARRAAILARPIIKAKRALAPAFAKLSLLTAFYYWLGGYRWAGPVNPAYQKRKGDTVITPLSQITSKLRKSTLMRHQTFKAKGGPLVTELRAAISTRGQAGAYVGTQGAIERMVSDGWVTVNGKPLRSLYKRVPQSRWAELEEEKGTHWVGTGQPLRHGLTSERRKQAQIKLTRRERLAEIRQHPVIVEEGAEIVVSDSKPGAQPFFGATYLIYKTYNPVLYRMATQNWTEANVFVNPQVWGAIDGVGVYGSAMRMVQWATLQSRSDVHEAVGDALSDQLSSAVAAVGSGHPGTVARDKGKGGKFSAAALTWPLGDTSTQARELWMYLAEDPQEAMQALKVGVRFDTGTYTQIGRMRRTRAIEVDPDEVGQSLIMSARRGVEAVRAVGGDEETQAARHILSKRLRKVLKILNAPQSGQTITDSNITRKISAFQEARGLPQTRVFDSDTILEMDVVLSPAFAKEESDWEALQFPKDERKHYPSGSMHERTADARRRYGALQGKISTALRDLEKNLKATRGQSKK